MSGDTRENLADRSTWLRLLYMILFVVVFNIAEFVIGVIVVVQFLFKLLTGHALDRLGELGHSLASYVLEIIVFLTFASEDMPYPFGPWPSAESTPAATKSAKRSRPRRRKSGTDAAPDEGGAPPAAA